MSQTMTRGPETVTAAVVEEIADAEGVAVFDVAPLFENIDPDALEAMFADPAAADHVTVEFSHSGYRVTIDGGRISIETPDGGS